MAKCFQSSLLREGKRNGPGDGANLDIHDAIFNL